MSAPERRVAGRRRARAVADAVLYEGYLLYPYRASSRKNRSRWQFGVLGPPGAEASGLGEDATMSAQCLIDPASGAGDRTLLTLTVRFLQLQHREVEDARGEPVDELTVAGTTLLAWDEAVEHELTFGPMPATAATVPLRVLGGTDIEELADPTGAPAGRLVRTRRSLRGELALAVAAAGDQLRLTVTVRNVGPAAADQSDAVARSLIGTHVVAEVTGAEFISLLDPPPPAASAAAACAHHRCFPVLAGQPGERDIALISPIILYDYPEIAEQSGGALFDCTEIDEILTLRIMTLTDEEKAQARATDPLAARIIERCEAMTPEAMAQLHGVLLDASRARQRLIPEVPDGVAWWDPSADRAVQPDTDAVLVEGVRVSRGSRVRLRPTRRADAHDLFYDGMLARVASVHQDVDGHAHIGVVVDDDPAAELHEWYGRYLYFAPDEVEPLSSDNGKEGVPWR
jgi:hypothetical protein